MKPGEGFAKLKGYDLEYFVQKLQTVLGRRSSSVSDTDVHLGSSKSISRRHAIIQYNFRTRSFELLVLSKRGAKVDNQLYPPSPTPIYLSNGSEIQIGDSAFVFLLPVSATVPTPSSTSSSSSSASLPTPQSASSRKRKTSNASASSIPTPGGAYGVQSFLPLPQSVLSSISSDPATLSSLTPQAAAAATAAAAEALRIANMPPPPAPAEKPTVSYATMISQALSQAPHKMLSLQGIYLWIENNYPYYHTADTTWRSSVRHNVSLSRFFRKVVDPEEISMIVDPAITGPNKNRSYYQLIDDSLLKALPAGAVQLQASELKQEESQMKMEDGSEAEDDQASSKRSRQQQMSLHP